MSHSIEDLREHLFATLAALRDEAKPMDLDRAKAVCEVGQVIINTAKVEVEHLRVTGHGKSAFLQLPAPDDEPPGERTQHGYAERAPGDGKGITGVTRHRLR